MIFLAILAACDRFRSSARSVTGNNTTDPAVQSYTSIAAGTPPSESPLAILLFSRLAPSIPGRTTTNP